MWDPETQFYYNVDRATNGFTVKTQAGATIDLRRKEIIGFLPLCNGYHREARELGERMIAAAATQLRKNHRFWESYSPDEEKQASPMNYIWDSILARVILDLEEDQR